MALTTKVILEHNAEPVKKVISCFSPFYSEAELHGALLDLALGLTVQHVCGWYSLNGQDDVTSTQVGPRCLTAGIDLEGTR